MQISQMQAAGVNINTYLGNLGEARVYEWP